MVKIMRLTIIIIIGFIANLANGQQSLNGDYKSLGTSGGYMFNIDDAAILTNPSLLGWQKDNFEHKMAINFADYWGAAYSPLASFAAKDFFDRDINFINEENMDLLDTYPLIFVTWDEMLSTNDYLTIPNYDTLVTRTSREGLKQSLMLNNSIKYNKTILGFTYISQNVGTFSFKINEETNVTTKLSEKFADLWAYGKTSSYFDTLIMYDGSHLANNSNSYQNSKLDSIYSAFSNDSLKIYQIMDGSYFNLMQTRKYSVGWGNTYKSKYDNIKLYTGATFNFIEGLNYMQIINNDDEIIVAKFGSGKLPKSKFGNAGLGASIGFSGTAVYKEKWMISAGINNLGFINWKLKNQNREGSYGVYSNGIDNKQYANYYYGSSKTLTFQDQLADAGFNWKAVNADYGRASIFRATPTNFHLGIRYLPWKTFSIGWNMVTPINKQAVGSMKSTLLAFTYKAIFKKFSVFGGVNNMNKTISVPFGFSIGSSRSKWEIGFSVSDLYGFFNEDLDNNFSGGVGLKYRIK
jgi:hypothetical protein